MKRSFLLVAVMLLGSAWSPPARAQFGFSGFGAGPDPLSQIETARSQAKQRLQQYARVSPGVGRAMTPRSSPGNSAFLDRFGRMDLSGRPVPGYPVVRGDLNTQHVSRGGANGAEQRRARRR
jgi:hypothetical protein